MNTVVLALLLACQVLASTPLIGAHRGLGAGEPENTLAAVQGSIAAGVDIVELDLRTTRDGAVVVMHDDRVDRTTRRSGRVADLTLAQVRQLDVKSAAGGSSGEHVPTLAEILPLVRESKARLLLDIKDGRRVNLADVLRQAADKGVSDRIVIGVRRLPDLAMVKSLDPEVTTLAFVPNLYQVDAFVAGGADIVRLWSDWIVADPGSVAAVHGNGRQVWTLVGRQVPGDPAELQALHRQLACAGVDAIVTDTPQLVPKSADDR